MDKNQQELMYKLSMFEQQIQILSQQLQAVEESIVEMNSLNFGLDELKGAKGKEILAPMGRGIFVKTKLSEEDLIVDIGGKNFVKKTISDTKKIIEEQNKKLEEVKSELNDKIEEIHEEATKMILEMQKNSKS